MALFHFHVDQIGRSAGRSAVACAAYRSGEKLHSEYYGETSDYTRKGGVMYSEIIAQVEVRIQNIRQQKLGSDNVYQYLLYFDKLYDKFTDAEKKEFLSSFVERVDIYEDELPDGRFLRHIKFKFPVFYNGQEIDEMSWDKESTVETIVLLQRETL